MRRIDLNADTGEADTPDWQATEAAVMQYISSANIACGGHAGDANSMKRMVALAVKNGVNIGAHPAYPDRENFGRKSLALGVDISKRDLKNALLSQITELCEIAAEQGRTVSYVKAHGALYNDAVFDAEKALLIASTVAELDSTLWLMGAPNSYLTKAAEQCGLEFIAEGFVDRRYTDDGHLQSRKESGAVLDSQSDREEQAVALLRNETIRTAQNNPLQLSVDTLCLHSDSAGADETAHRIRRALINQGADIKAFIDER